MAFWSQSAEVNVKLGSEQNHLFFCFSFCFLTLLERVPLISASKLVIEQNAAYVRLLRESCSGVTSSTLPQSWPQSAVLPLWDDLVSNFYPLICILFLGLTLCSLVKRHAVARITWEFKWSINTHLCRPWIGCAEMQSHFTYTHKSVVWVKRECQTLTFNQIKYNSSGRC